MFFVSSIPGIPLSAYQTFVLEEKHGFNKTTPGLFVTDTIKGWLVGFVVGGPFLAAFLKIFQWAGDSFVPFLMAFLYVCQVRMILGPRTETPASRLAFQILMVLIYPTVIQPLFNKLTPLPEGELRKRTESLASKLRFPLKHLYEIDGSKRSSHSNAYFFGLPWVTTFLSFRGSLTHTFIEQTHCHLRYFD